MDVRVWWIGARADGARARTLLRAGQVALLIGAAVAGAGCRATLRDSRSPTGEEHRYWSHYFVFGAWGHPSRDVRDACGERNATLVSRRATVLTVVVGVATLGLYTPQVLRITCEARQP